jgi:hypothetical protein
MLTHQSYRTWRALTTADARAEGLFIHHWEHTCYVTNRTPPLDPEIHAGLFIVDYLQVQQIANSG